MIIIRKEGYFLEHTVIFGNNQTVLKKIKDNSIQLIITSPPYWNKKNYGNHIEQIGYYDSYMDYIQKLNNVWSECKRILMDEGRLCINIGDVFTSTKDFGKYKVLPVHSEIIMFCESIGLDYMNTILWQKIGNATASGGAKGIMGSYLQPPNGIIQNDIEYILVFKKYGKKRKVSKEIKEKSKLTKEEWITYFSQVWNIPGVRQIEHEAMFPDEIPRRLIKMFSFWGDTVLDPFLGSGTTSKIAIELERSSIGIEINDTYRSLIEKKLNNDNVNYIYERDVF